MFNTYDGVDAMSGDADIIAQRTAMAEMLTIRVCAGPMLGTRPERPSLVRLNYFRYVQLSRPMKVDCVRTCYLLLCGQPNALIVLRTHASA
jgi:hypothetical protein